MFSSRLTLHGEFFSRRMAFHENKTRQREFVGALTKWIRTQLIAVEHTEPAIGHQRHNIATAKADIGVGVEHRVGYQAGRVIIRINGFRREVFGKNGIDTAAAEK